MENIYARPLFFEHLNVTIANALKALDSINTRAIKIILSIVILTSVQKENTAMKYTTQYINDSSLPVGTQKVVQNGNNGSKYEAYKVKRLNGEVVSRTLLSKDTYNAMQKIVRVGTGN